MFIVFRGGQTWSFDREKGEMVILYKNGIVSLQKVRSEHTVVLPEKASRMWQCKRMGKGGGGGQGTLHLLLRKMF